MNEKLEKIKVHVIKHKTAYVSVAVGVASAGITCLIMRNNSAHRGESEGFNAHRGLANTVSHCLSFGTKQSINVVTVLEREGKGHPGWPVRNLETKRVFFSQREAAKAFDISEGNLSGHLAGKYENVNGLHFERVNLFAPEVA